MNKKLAQAKKNAIIFFINSRFHIFFDFLGKIYLWISLINFTFKKLRISFYTSIKMEQGPQENPFNNLK